MTWPTSLVEDLFTGKGAKVTGRDAWDRSIEALGAGSTPYFAAVSTASASYAALHTWTEVLPEAMRSGTKIKLSFLARRTGSSSADYRLEEAGGTTGTAINVTETVDTIKTVEITVPDNTWAGTLKTFSLKAKGNGGATANATTARVLAARRFTSA